MSEKCLITIVKNKVAVFRAKSIVNLSKRDAFLLAQTIRCWSMIFIVEVGGFVLFPNQSNPNSQLEYLMSFQTL